MMDSRSHDFDEFRENRTPHAVAGRGGRDGRYSQRLGGFGQSHDVVLELSSLVVAHTGHQADLMIDQNERGIVGGQGSIGLAVVVHVVSLWLRERGAAAAKDATVPAGSAEGAAQSDSLAAMRSASMMVVTLVATGSTTWVGGSPLAVSSWRDIEPALEEPSEMALVTEAGHGGYFGNRVARALQEIARVRQ